MDRVVLSRWSLAVACIACVLVMFDERPLVMEMRLSEPHGIVGIPKDVHTRIVSDSGAVRAGRAQMAVVRVEAPATATFQVSNSTFDPVPPQALAAFQYAADIWARLINSSVPIRVNVGWNANPGSLAHGSAAIYRNFPNAPQPNVWYSKPLADALAGADVQQPGALYDIGIQFSSTANWYFGTDGLTPAGQYDFVTVAMHEIAHHIGFVTLMFGHNGFGQWGIMGSPTTYSRHLVNGLGQSLLNTSLFPNPSVALGTQLSSNNIFWSGPIGMAALGGVRPKIFTPNPWTDGQASSLNHLDEVTFPPGNPNSLMTPVLNTAEAIHVPGPVTLGMLADMGWAPDSTCSISIDRPEATFTPAGASNAAVGVIAPAICPWTAVSNSPFITITGGASGNGPSPITFSVSANPGSFRTGTITVSGRTFTVRQLGNAPTMTLDRTTLNFGAVSLGGMFTSQTSAQTVRLRQSGLPGTVTWTAQSTQPWLQVTPASGTGSTDLSISIVPAAGVPISGIVNGTIQLTLNGAGNDISPIQVALTTVQNGLSVPPIGIIDTPTDLQSGITGAIAFTGWALDDVEIDRIAICRLPYYQFEASLPLSPHCGGRNDVFLGFAVRVDGARPDVATAFPGYPLNTKGGWGFMLLTNMLPAGGNGPYIFLAFAYDREGMVTRLGSRLIYCENSSATKPFGAIDTPEQGGVASGGAYVNFGWALTQNPKTIPTDGSTITVLVDGAPIGNASYNNFRSDIASLFPGRNNSNGAVGYKLIDTTALENGVHTISWIVTDDQGNSDGIGSRYFTVSNGAAGLTAAGASARMADHAGIHAASVDRRGVLARRGFDLNAPWTTFGVNADGRAVIRGEELDRFELALHRGDGEQLAGFLRAGDRLEPLPAGARLDASTGSFTWAPGVGFVGTYDLVFVRSRRDRIVSRQDVRFILHAKGSGRVGPQITIDTPRWQHDVAQPFTIAGWAVDLDANDGTGIGAVHVWAYPLAGGPPVFLGAAAIGGRRPDVAAIHGERFRDSGFGLNVQGLTHGNYDLAVFAWSNQRGDFAPAKVVRVTIR